MSLVPKFWGRVVILVDAPATPLCAVISQLEWSRDRHLEVVVTRRTFHKPVDGQHERSNVDAIIKLLLQHIHRIKKLRFDVMFSSSLPSFPTDFHGNATIMKDLELQCMEDDGGTGRTEPGPSWSETEEFECPKLQSLVIDGRNYYEACKGDLRWIKVMAAVQSLAISHFQPRPHELFTTHELLQPLTALPDSARVRITDLVLHPSPSPEGPQLAQQLQHVAHLILQDLHDSQVTDEILTVLDHTPNFSFIRCSLGPFGRGFGPDGSLLLKEIDQDLVPLLSYWYGCDLNVVNCPLFDDRVLEMMSAVEHGTFVCAPLAGRLIICDCSNFTFEGLRRLVETRLQPPSDFDHPFDPFDPISTQLRLLNISGNVPPLSVRDRVWFMDNVPAFVYNPR